MMTTQKKLKLNIQRNGNHSDVSGAAENSAISILTDDSLRHVFSFLSVKDRIRIQRVCKRWQTLGLLPWHDFKELEVGLELFSTDKEKLENPTQVFKQLLTVCGPCLTTVRAGYNCFMTSTDLVKLITKMCPNVRSLHMSHMTFTRKTLELLASNCTNLTRISIGECWKNCEHILSELFSENKRLHSVAIRCCNVLTGSCLSSLNPESIESLEIDDSRNLSLDNALSAIRNFRKLRILKLCQDYYRSKLMYSVDEILNNIPVKSSLEELKLVNTPHTRLLSINNIAGFVNLKKLYLHGESFVNNVNLSILANFCTSLKELTLHGSKRVTYQGWKKFAKKIKLEMLEIIWMDMMTDKFLLHVPDTLIIFKCNGCRMVTNKTFSSIMSKARNLQYLEMLQCDDVDRDMLVKDAIEAKKILNDNHLELRIEVKKDYRQVIDITPHLRLVKDPMPSRDWHLFDDCLHDA